MVKPGNNADSQQPPSARHCRGGAHCWATVGSCWAAPGQGDLRRPSECARCPVPARQRADPRASRAADPQQPGNEAPQRPATSQKDRERTSVNALAQGHRSSRKQELKCKKLEQNTTLEEPPSVTFRSTQG